MDTAGSVFGGSNTLSDLLEWSKKREAKSTEALQATVTCEPQPQVTSETQNILESPTLEALNLGLGELRVREDEIIREQGYTYNCWLYFGKVYFYTLTFTLLVLFVLWCVFFWIP